MKEERRDGWGVRFPAEVPQDLRYGLRQLRRNPGFTALAVLAIALGVGANTAIFSLSEAVLSPPFAGANRSRLASVYTSGEHGSGYASTSYPDYLYYREHSRSFSGIAAFARIEAAWTHGGTTDLPWAEVVSGNYFRVLGVRPVRGRFFLPTEGHTSPAPVVVVSYRFWREELGSAAELGDRTLTLNGKLFTIIGVAPQGFEGVQLNWGGSPDFWLPMRAEPAFLRVNLLNMPAARWCLMAGRLRAGATLAQAASEIRVLAEQLARAYPEADKGRTALVMPFDQGRIWPTWREKITSMVWMLGFFAGLVLLVACLDVANLLLARGASRQKEVGVKLALGAGRARIVRQLLTESALISFAGAGSGALLARWMAAWMTKFRDLFTVQLALHPPALDSRVLGFAAALAILAALAFGLAPSFQISHLDLNASLKETGSQASSARRHQWLRHSLVVAAVAVAFVGVAGSAMLLRTLWRLDSADLGLDPHHVLSVSTEIFTRGYKTDEGIRFYSELLDRVRSLAGVQSAAVALDSPLTTLHSSRPVARPDEKTLRPEEWKTVEGNTVSAGYFGTLRIALLRGRDFRPEDDAKAPPVVIVNQTMAQMFWPASDAVGRHLWVEGQKTEAEVVGVASDIKQHTAWQAAEPLVYQPFTQSAFHSCHLLVRTNGDPMALLPAVRRQVDGLDPLIPVYDAETMEQVAADSTAEPRMAASLVSLFGGLALLLAVVGIYGVVAHWAAQRTREIGIRMALGAARRDVVKMVAGQGLKLTLAGVAIGMAGAVALARFLSSLFYGVKPAGPLTFIAVALILAAVALAACYIPAHRAARVDPMTALRYE